MPKRRPILAALALSLILPVSASAGMSVVKAVRAVPLQLLAAEFHNNGKAADKLLAPSLLHELALALAHSGVSEYKQYPALGLGAFADAREPGKTQSTTLKEFQKGFEHAQVQVIGSDATVIASKIPSTLVGYTPKNKKIVYKAFTYTLTLSFAHGHWLITSVLMVPAY
jgi:hypothetical protein